MRILDENDNELQPKDVDGRLGHLDVQPIVVAHYDGREAQEEKSHYKVKRFYFTDGTSLSVREGDPHIIPVDMQTGRFEYKSLEGEPHKEVASMDIELVIDEPAIAAREPEDKIEYIQRYILFTPQELERNKQLEEEEAAREKFLTFGPKRIQELENKIEEIMAMLQND